MKSKIDLSEKHRIGYTLTELLLTVSLVLMLAGAVVFNFSSSANSVRLNEGASQVESLFRFARAHAESTGKQVRIQFPEAESGDGAELLAAEAPGITVRVMWEANPVGAPGVFQDLPQAASYVQSISELVSIQQVQSIGLGVEASADAVTPIPTSDAPETFAAESPHSPIPAVTFYPDGTGDSVELVLSSRDEEDVRRFTINIVGITGSIRRQLIEPTTEVSD